jgi:membrane complex biogenesis BtpA family protein
VENFGDTPFPAGRSAPETIAFVTAAARSVREETGLPLGVNLLRNDGEGALAAACAAGGSFIRVNVLTHAMMTDQGVIEGRAHDLLRRRRALGADVAIWADLLVKHAVPLAPVAAETAARDLVARGGADAVIVTGEATGAGADAETVRLVASLGLGVPLLVGSGVTPESAAAFGGAPDGYIVSTWCKREGRIDAGRVRRLAGTIHGGTP